MLSADTLLFSYLQENVNDKITIIVIEKLLLPFITLRAKVLLMKVKEDEKFDAQLSLLSVSSMVFHVFTSPSTQVSNLFLYLPHIT